ncbi:MAG: adenylate kinase family protein [Candidatus Babeliales bacterium]
MIFIGPPGAGKGSLAHMCVKQLGWVQLSTGNLCRKHIIEQTNIGKEIDFAIKSGNLVSDVLITSMVEEWLTQECDKQPVVILDGFPRTAEQAQLLNNLVESRFKDLAIQIVTLHIPDSILVDRLSSRIICQNKDCQAVYSLAEGSLLRPTRDMVCDFCSSALGRRKDDEYEAIKERLAVYRRHEHELLEFYTTRKQPMIQLDVANPLADVFKEFQHMIGLKTI